MKREYGTVVYYIENKKMREQMKKTMCLILAFLGTKRKVPKTKFGRVLRRSEKILAIIFLFYLALLVNPTLLFADQISHGSLHLHFRDSQIPNSAIIIMEKAEKIAKESEIWQDYKKFDVFCCDGFGMYTFFCPSVRNSFGATHPATGNIFLARTDFKLNLAYRNGDFQDTRELTHVIAHEITHEVVKAHLGFWRYMVLPDWKNEGYCEVISRGPLANLQMEIQNWANSTDKTSKKELYRKYRLLVAFLMQSKNMNFSEVVSNDMPIEKVEKEMLIWSSKEN